uniref:T cell receptor beta variable 30 n=1 Tax=Loxodonta africana TaxID=9785 RepID=G3U173_LOXAF
RAQTISQWPVVEVRRVGSPLSLQCTVTGTSNPYLYWYRQAPGGPPQLLFFSVGVNDVQTEAPEHLSASRPQDGQFTLSSEKLQPGDSGVYLCAWG